MNKMQKTAINIITILLLNITFWICNNYPRHILEFGEITSGLSAFVNLLYFVFFYYFVVLVFKRNETLFSNSFWDEKTAIIFLPLLLIIQLIFDGANIVLNSIGVKFNFISTGILTVIQWILIYAILTKGNANIFKKRKPLLTTMVSLAIIIGVSIAFDFLIFKEYTNALMKYESQSEILKAIINNTEFFNSIKLLILDTVTPILLLIVHGIVIREENNLKCGFPVFFIRTVVLVVGAVIAVLLKTRYLPFGAIINANTQDRSHTNEATLGVFDTEIHDFTLYRFRGEDVPCYSNRTVSISKGESASLSLQIPIKENLYTHNIGNNSFQTFIVNDTPAYIYNSQVVCYYEGDEQIPRNVALKSLSTYGRDDTVIEVCRQELRNGNIYIFEYCCDYLLKYDNEFIQTYIDRYANGDFSPHEKQWMTNNYYKNEFITDIAKSKS